MLTALRNNKSLTFYQTTEFRPKFSVDSSYTGGITATAISSTAYTTATVTTQFNNQLNAFLDAFHALQDEVHICPCHGNAAGQSLFVGFGVDVVLFQKHQPDALAVKVFVQSKTLFCISGHSGHRIEHPHIPRF